MTLNIKIPIRESAYEMLKEWPTVNICFSVVLFYIFMTAFLGQLIYFIVVQPIIILQINIGGIVGFGVAMFTVIAAINQELEIVRFIPRRGV